MEAYISITIILLISLIFAEIFRRFKIPIVMGYLVTGLLLSVISVFFPSLLLSSKEFIKVFSDLGIVFLIFLVGIETNIKALKQNNKEEILIAFFSAGTTFLLGFIVSYLLGFHLFEALAIGAMLSITSEGTKAMILLEYNKLKSKVGSIMIGASITDDVLEIIFLSIVVIMAHEGNIHSLIYFPIKLLLFVGLIWIMFIIFVPLLKNRFKDIKKYRREEVLAIIIIMMFFMAGIASYLGLGPVIGAFFAGIILQKMLSSHSLKVHIIEYIKAITISLIIPFFFVHMGLNFKFSSVFLNKSDLIFFILILLVAIFGKIIGTLFVKPFTNKLTLRQLFLIGWGMNSRGAVELVIAEIARRSNLISLTTYSVIILVTLITTMLFPIVFRYYIKKYPKILDE